MCRDGRFTIPIVLLLLSALVCFAASILLTYAVFSASFRTFDDGRYKHSFGLIRYCKIPLKYGYGQGVQCFSREIRQRGIEPPGAHLLIAQSELMVLIVLVLAMHLGLLSTVSSLLAFCSKMCAKLSRILLMLSGSCTFFGSVLFSHFATSSLNTMPFIVENHRKVEYKFGTAFGWCLVAGSGFLLSLLFSIVSTLIDDELDLFQTAPMRRASAISQLPRKISRRVNEAIRRGSMRPSPDSPLATENRAKHPGKVELDLEKPLLPLKPNLVYC